MRIAGITIPEDKRLEIALTAVFGVGRPQARRILDECSIDASVRANDLSDEQELAIREAVEHLTIEGDLRRERSANIKRLIDIQSYRGMRHSRKLPTRGQNTKTNSRTMRGNTRATAGSGRVKVSKT
ncbi:MAG: 30S ribosomal protein S13 [Patescibacteria group bacterium]